MTKTTDIRKTLAAGLLAAIAVAPLAGCRGERTDANPRRFFPDMDYQPRWDAQEPSNFYADGRTARTTPEHAVAFASSEFDVAAHSGKSWAKRYTAERAAMLKDNDAVYTGKVVEADGVESYLDTMPVAVTREMVERGQHQFNIYCVACHGYLGDGKGMVGTRWSYPPANLTGEVYRDRANRQGKDGYLFEVLREGVWAPDGTNKMPGYKHAINEMDAWAVVAYLRTIQKARGSSWDELTPDQQAALGRPTPAPEPEGDQTTEGGES